MPRAVLTCRYCRERMDYRLLLDHLTEKHPEEYRRAVTPPAREQT